MFSMWTLCLHCVQPNRSSLIASIFITLFTHDTERDNWRNGPHLWFYPMTAFGPNAISNIIQWKCIIMYRFILFNLWNLLLVCFGLMCKKIQCDNQSISKADFVTKYWEKRKKIPRRSLIFVSHINVNKFISYRWKQAIKMIQLIWRK